jgi:hypothetical protein
MFIDKNRKTELEAFKEKSVKEKLDMEHYETVVVAGLVFYLDHNNQTAVPLSHR